MTLKSLVMMHLQLAFKSTTAAGERRKYGSTNFTDATYRGDGDNRGTHSFLDAFEKHLMRTMSKLQKRKTSAKPLKIG